MRKEGTALKICCFTGHRTVPPELSPDLIIVVAYGKILPVNVLEYPKYGCINVHGSLLPKYRGAAPMQRAIIDGKPALTCVASDKAVKAGIHAGKLVGACAAIVGGKGGGRPNAAQAGGTDADKLDEAIQHIYTLV